MRFYHSGDLGDIVYAIPSMRALCLKDGTQANICLGDRDWTRSRWTEQLLSTIEPLLKAQDFVTSVAVLPKSGHPEIPFTDFSTFRHGGYKLGDTIYERQRRWVRAKADISLPWLQVSKGTPLENGRIVINRTPRWEGWFFPWEEILEAFHQEMVFIGLPSEHAAFERQFGEPVEFHHCDNLLEAAQLIAGSAFFIGNQSVCGAIANGLHKSMLTEVCPYACDCVLPRENAFYCLDGRVDLQILGRVLKTPAQDVSRQGQLESVFFANAKKILTASKSLCSEVALS